MEEATFSSPLFNISLANLRWMRGRLYGGSRLFLATLQYFPGNLDGVEMEDTGIPRSEPSSGSYPHEKVSDIHSS